MYGSSPKAGLAQKKKKQAIRRLSQTGRKGSGNVAGGGRGRARRPSQQGQSATQNMSQPGSQSSLENPFLKALPATDSQVKTLVVKTNQGKDNPFLSGLTQHKSEDPLPSSRRKVKKLTVPHTMTLPIRSATVPSTSSSLTGHPPDIHSTSGQLNPFLAPSPLKASSTGKLNVHLSMQSDTKPKVSFDPLLESQTTRKRRVPSYSEVVAAHTQSKPATQPQQYANLKTLHIKGIPNELNTSEILRSHFAKFGQVKLLKCFPAKMFATVEFASREEAVIAKKAGKIISPKHDPLIIFWHASRQPSSSTQPDVPIISSGNETSTDPKIKKPVKQQLNQQGDTQPAKNFPLQQSVQNKPKQSNVWSRLGPEKKDADEEWTPDKADGGDEQQNEYVDEGVCEGPNFIQELGLKVTGDEMDTIARSADHPYFLRSLMQPDTGPSTLTQPLATVTSTDTNTSLPDSRQLYNIPIPDIPLLPHTRGHTATECYESLDARDQQIRKGTVKKTVLSEARVIVGTCPDLCPEKERYRREYTRRLSWFEVSRDSTTGGRKPNVNHKKAIKEYSGSAADKEEPLPHDLRPLSVLQMTMDYLVTRVMDDYQERPADWYDFVWNRTRGIRKDITIQHLCTVESTELTEKCARFHILCSYLLCEEDTNTFDPRMNSENLNKCLLSLKQFYRDLRVEKGVLCPNEAEFCCYDILLHLTDGNVLDLVTQYSPSVIDTLAVRFAIDVALSFDSNNFVKFFKLARTATFLNGCVLHRYFNLARTRAVEVLNRSHTSQKRPTNFPLSDLSRILAFETNEKAAVFCELSFNLTVPPPRKTVQFLRGGMTEGEQMPAQKSYHLVDCKNKKPLGEVVYGKPLPPLFNHTPFSSFSSEGLPLRSITPPPPTYVPPPLPREPSYTKEDLMTAVESVECEAVSVCVEDVVFECLREEIDLLREIEELACIFIQEELLHELIKAESQEVAQKAVLETLEVKAIKDKMAESAVTEALDVVLKEAVEEIIQSIYWDCVLTAQAKEAAVIHLTVELVEECVCEGVRGLVCETLEQVKHEKKEKLEAIRRECLLQRTLKYWQRWRLSLKAREHVRQCASDIPPLPPMMSLPWQLDILCPLEKRRKVEVATSFETAGQLEDSKKERDKRRHEFYAPLNLPLILQDSLLAFHTPSHPHTPHIYWKLAFIYPPQNTLPPSDKHTLNWLYRKLKTVTGLSVPSKNTELLALYSAPVQGGVLDHWDKQATRKLNVAVQGICSHWRGEVNGASGIMLYAQLPQGESIQEYIESVFEMLGVVMRSHKSSTPVPLLLAHSRELEDNHLAAWISLRRAFGDYCKQPQSCLSDVECLKLDIPSYVPPTQTTEEEAVCTRLRWLVEHSPSPPTLFHTPVKDYVEKGLLDLFVPLVVSDSTAREKATLPSQAPAPIISLYNYILDHLATVATGEELEELDWPIPEYAAQTFTQKSLPPVFWNRPSYLSKLQTCLASLQLPSPALSLGPHWTEAEWSTQCSQCLNYVASLQLPGSPHGSVTLLSRIKALLHRHHHMFECGETDEPECCVPWTHVILACIEHILSCLDSDLWASTLHSVKRKFTVPTSWLRAQAETSLATASQLTGLQSPRKIRHRRHRSDPPHLTGTPLHSSTHYPSPSPTPKPPSSVGVSPYGVHGNTTIPSTVSLHHETTAVQVRELTQKLTLLQMEKAHSQRFEAQLQEWMSSTSVPSPPVVSEQVSSEGRPKPSSLSEKLEELQAGIRTARWKEKETNTYLRALSRT